MSHLCISKYPHNNLLPMMSLFDNNELLAVPYPPHSDLENDLESDLLMRNKLLLIFSLLMTLLQLFPDIRQHSTDEIEYWIKLRITDWLIRVCSAKLKQLRLTPVSEVNEDDEEDKGEEENIGECLEDKMKDKAQEFCQNSVSRNQRRPKDRAHPLKWTPAIWILAYLPPQPNLGTEAETRTAMCSGERLRKVSPTVIHKLVISV